MPPPQAFEMVTLKLKFCAVNIICLFITNIGWFGTAHGLTLEQALVHGLLNSRDLAASQQAWVASRESVFSSLGSGDYSVTYTGSGSYSRTDSGSGFTSSDTYSNKITVSKDIFDFGKADASIVLAEINLDLAYATYRNTEQSVILEIATAYLSLIKTRQELQLNEENLERLAAHVSAAKLRVAEGTGTSTSLAEANARYSRAQADKISAATGFENAKDLFLKLTEIEEEEMSGISQLPSVEHNLPTSINEAEKQAKINNPSVLSALATERAAAQTIITTTMQQKPSVSMSMSGTQGEASDSLSISLSFSTPLYDSMTTVANARKTVANHSKALIDLEEAQLTAELDARSAFRDLQAARTSLEAVKSEYSASRLVAEGISKEVKFGLKTPLDLLDAEKSVKDAELRLVDVEHDRLLASLNLSASLGTLTSENLGLNNVDVDFNNLSRPENPLKGD